MTDQPELYSQSDEVQEIMNFMPHWIVRSGITIVFITILMLLVVSWLIKYPDVIKARITIMSKVPPIEIVARSTGKWTLYVEDHNSVTAGTVLAVIENPAKISDVFAFKKSMMKFRSFSVDPFSITNVSFDRNASLGEMQDTYAEFIKDVNSFKLILKHKDSSGIEDSASPQYGDAISKLIHQKVLLTKETKLAEKKYTSSKILFKQGLISEVELADLEVEFNKKRATLEYVIGDIKHVNNNLILSIQLIYKRLESQLAEWDYDFILTAPVDGKVSFFKFWSNNQFVTSGDIVMTIVPQSHNIIGKVKLPIAGSGKVNKGQKVYIQCDNYPYREYGYVKGQVESISLMPQDNLYIVNVILPEELKTTFNKQLEFKQEMEGTARIITKDLRLLQRFFYEFRYLFGSSI